MTTRRWCEEETLLRWSRLYCVLQLTLQRGQKQEAKLQITNQLKSTSCHHCCGSTQAACRAACSPDIRLVCTATVVLTGLEPNTTYEVRVAAVNGKGQGEFSHAETFQTLPIREFRRLHRTQKTSTRPPAKLNGSISCRDLLISVMFSGLFFYAMLAVLAVVDIKFKPLHERHHCLLQYGNLMNK